ncbi:hypothetical protein JCM10207_002059 [Rhodosporidiobolus poonsookiae]
MPPRKRARRGDPAQAPAPAQGTPAPPPLPPGCIADTPTVHLLPSEERGGYAVNADVYFASEPWITPLRADVDALLCAFAEQWEASSSAYASADPTAASTSTTAAEDEQLAQESPFEVFKRVWVELGWSAIHLLGVPDGPLRSKWGDSVLRAFVERLKPDEEPLKQIAGLFAVYTFWGTQEGEVKKLFVKADPPTVEYILTLPETLAPALDASRPSLDPPPSADLSFILGTLCSEHAFLLLPTEIYAHPTLPAVYVVTGTENDTRDLAVLLLGAEEEADALREGGFSRVAKRALRDAEDDEDDEEEEDEEEDAEEEEDEDREPDLPSWGAPRLSALADAYARTKIASAATVAFKSTSTLTSAQGSTSGGLSTLVRPRNALQLDVLRRAEALTREAMERLPGAVPGMGFGGVGEGPQGLLGLVGGDGAGGGSEHCGAT